MIPSDSKVEDNVRVCARFRPLNRAEDQAVGGPKMCVNFLSQDSLDILTKEEDFSHQFTFSAVYPPQTAQSTIYDEVGAPVIRDVLNGYNGTIFVYGQTGSGKTHTMMGAVRGMAAPGGQLGDLHDQMSPISTRSSVSGSAAFAPVYNFDGPQAGIIPRAVLDLFHRMEVADEDVEFEIKIHFVEIYMEHVRDLLNPSHTNLNVREETTTNSFYVEGCECPYVSSASEVFQMVELGLRNRTTASTRMNDTSSRSHCILGINVKGVNKTRGEQKTGKLFLVDLAGSEKVAKTRAEGVQLEEAKLINKSLTTLGMVINTLSDRRAQHIPYRDSKLTKILQDSLGGNSRTTLVVCCSPAAVNDQETLSTLRFGARAKNITNRAVVNKEYTVDELKSMLAHAQQQIEKLRGGKTPHGQACAALALAGGSGAETLGMLQLQARLKEQTLLADEAAAQAQEALRDVKEQLYVREAQAKYNQAQIVSLQEEITVWQLELAASAKEVRSLKQRLEKEKLLRVADRSHMDEYITNTTKSKGELQAIRCMVNDALRELQMPSAASPDVPLPLAAAPALLSASPERSESTLQNSLQLAEKRIADLECSWKELINENGALTLLMQLADKKISIRNDRIENLKNGLKHQQDNARELSAQLGSKEKEYLERLTVARSDVEFWRRKYELLAAETRTAERTESHHHLGRIVKHVRGGVKASSPNSEEKRPHNHAE
jgi:hypothetical protein